MVVQRKCPHCGFRMFTDSPNCTNCGKPMKDEGAPKPPPPIDEPKEESNMVPYTSPREIAKKETETFFEKHDPPNSLRPLPTSYRKFGPALAFGKVVDNRQQSVEDKSHKAGETARNIIGTAVTLFKPAIGISILLSGMGRPKNYKNEVVFSMEKVDMTEVGVRVIRELKTGQIRLGDFLSVWGRDVGGEIVLEIAYNHTLGCEIKLA